jgi:two-component system, chemotaxis family, chemotaxis protein CheY
MMPNILIVDDSLLVRRQVSAALKAIGYLMLEAVDGIDALAKLDANPDTRLIVCDVNMPRMNGIELLERLLARGSAIPIVMLTTEGQPELIQRAKALGAKGWIVKPFKPEFLIATAKKLAPLPVDGA